MVWGKFFLFEAWNPLGIDLRVSPMGPCYGPLLDSGGVCSMGLYFVYGTELVCIGVQIRGPYHRRPLGISVII